MLGTIQAAEVLKFLTGAGELLTNHLLTFNAKTMNFRKVALRQTPKCPVCGEHPSITELVEAEQAACELKRK
jgi:adenylyltransferase/sulfurtransferase